HPLRPARLAVLGAVGDVDDPKQVAPPGDVVDPHEQLADEQVLVGRGPEERLQHVLPEEPAAGGVGRRAHQKRSMRSWRSVKARSRTSKGTPSSSKHSSRRIHSSWRSHEGQAASRSATVSGYGYPGKAASLQRALRAPRTAAASASAGRSTRK